MAAQNSTLVSSTRSDCGTIGAPTPRAACATYDSSITEVRARSAHPDVAGAHRNATTPSSPCLTSDMTTFSRVCRWSDRATAGACLARVAG